jgi:hypothetical protein
MEARRYREPMGPSTAPEQASELPVAETPVVIATAEETPAGQQPEPAKISAPAWKMEPVELPADMVMVETRSGAVAPAPLEVPEERSAPRKPRPSLPPAGASEEPLVQVETRGENGTASSNPA